MYYNNNIEYYYGRERDHRGGTRVAENKGTPRKLHRWSTVTFLIF